MPGAAAVLLLFACSTYLSLQQNGEADCWRAAVYASRPRLARGPL